MTGSTRMLEVAFLCVLLAAAATFGSRLLVSAPARACVSSLIGQPTR